jgi:hypothetical protein
LAHNFTVDGGELPIENVGAKDDHVVTRLAFVPALVLTVAILVDGEGNVPASDEVDVLVVAASTEG